MSEEKIAELQEEIRELHKKFNDFTMIMERRFDYWLLFVLAIFIVIFYIFT